MICFLGDHVKLEWENESGHVGSVPLSFLIEHDYSDEKRQETAENVRSPRFCMVDILFK